MQATIVTERAMNEVFQRYSFCKNTLAIFHNYELQQLACWAKQLLAKDRHFAQDDV